MQVRTQAFTFVGQSAEEQPELEKEREERKEAELSVAALERQLASIKDQCALLDVEIEQRRAVVMNLRRGTLHLRW